MILQKKRPNQTLESKRKPTNFAPSFAFLPFFIFFPSFPKTKKARPSPPPKENLTPRSLAKPPKYRVSCIYLVLHSMRVCCFHGLLMVLLGIHCIAGVCRMSIPWIVVRGCLYRMQFHVASKRCGRFVFFCAFLFVCFWSIG